MIEDAGRELRARLAPVARRQRRRDLLRAVARGLFLGSAIAVALAALRCWLPAPVVVGLVAASVAAGGLLGIVAATRAPRNLRAAAVAVDAHHGLQDRTVTALAFVEKSEPSPLERMQVADALERIASVDAKRVVPIRLPKRLPGAAVLVGVAVAMLAWPMPVSRDWPEAPKAAAKPQAPAPPAATTTPPPQATRAEPDPAAAARLRAEIQWRIAPPGRAVPASAKPSAVPALDQLARTLAEETTDRQPSGPSEETAEVVLRREPPPLEYRRAIRRYLRSIEPPKEKGGDSG